MMDKETIFLVGFMGSGKSSVGKLLADALGYAFIDTDKAIEKRSGKSINTIFDEFGENYFRMLESKLLETLCRKKKIVIATGGGMPIYNDNMAMMKENGCVIYLSIHLSRIVKRLAKDQSRPLFKKTSKKQLENMLNHRRPVYNKADWTVLAFRPAPMVVSRIIALLDFR